jgi:hypothetical protein
MNDINCIETDWHTCRTDSITKMLNLKQLQEPFSGRMAKTLAEI